MYNVVGFTNKYLVDNGVVLNFHDDVSYIPKEIKSLLETNGYDIHSKWDVINTLPWMSSEIKGKMVTPLLICVYITFQSKDSYANNFFLSPPCRFD
jgi:hypothetical protein